MANYLSLEEAAAALGIPPERLIDLRSQGQVRGFRDGASWKFADADIDRLKDDPDVLAGGSDIGLGGEATQPGSGSDVNLVPAEGDGSDVAVVAGDSDLDFESAEDLLEIDSGELQLQDPAIMHDSAQLDLAVEPNAGSTGPVTDEELKEISESHPDVLPPQHDSGDALGDLESDIEMLDGKKGGGSGVASSLELMDSLEESDSQDEAASNSSRGADVLSELDLLSAEQEGSGIISGDSENLLASSGLGSSIGADALGGSDLSALDDDALADDDDLVIADDDDDLMLSSAGSDISVAGDSGINLMSPSDSGLSLESEPLDLAGSSISALDLGAELSDGGSSGSGSAGSSGDGSAVDFQAEEEFQLSPSSVGLEADIESGSQVIEVEDSEAIAEPVEFEEAGFDDQGGLGGDVFGEEQEEGVGEALALDDSEPIADSAAPAVRSAYEIPFTMLQCVTLVMIMFVLSLGGMLMTDLVRNMWTYAEPSAPVSSLTDSLVSLMGWGQ